MADHGCPFTDSLGTIESMENKCPDDTLRMHRTNLNVCFLRMLEDICSFGTTHITLFEGTYYVNTSV